MEFFIIVLVLVSLAIYKVIVYIPNKLKEQEEKQSLYVKELYIRINMLESKIDELIDLNKNEIWSNNLNALQK